MQALKRIFGRALRYDVHSLEKPSVLAAHRDFPRRISQESLGPSIVESDVIPGASSGNLASLSRIRLRELRRNAVHKGRFLHGFLAAAPCRAAQVAANVFQEEEDGAMAAQLLVNNYLLEDEEEEVERLLPRGAEVIIKEPFLVQDYPLKGICLWVSNPASIQVVSYFPKGSESECDETRSYQELGDEAFQKRKYGAAIELYTKFLDDHQAGEELKVMALCDRAEAWLESGWYSNALEDAESALKLKPGNFKGIECKVRALWELNQYSQAHRFLEQCRSSSQATQGLEQQALMFKEESELGKYNILHYIGGISEGQKVAEYVGPVEISMTPDGRGRGLFTTEDVCKGQLLFVNNAVSSVTGSDLLQRLSIQVLRACWTNQRTLARVYSMQEFVPSSGDYSSKGVPSMASFRPNDPAGIDCVNEELDVSRIRSVVACTVDYDGDKFMGLWTLSPFINHSCLPNVSLLPLGRAMFAYASKDMKRGSELSRAYINVLSCYAQRKAAAAGANFVCSCVRCELENRLEKQLEDVHLRLQQLVSLVDTSKDKHLEHLGCWGLSKLAMTVEDHLSSLGELSNEEKHWLRASYFRGYAAYYDLVSLGMPPQPRMPPKDTFALSILEVHGESGAGLQIILDCIRSGSAVVREAMVSLYGPQVVQIMLQMNSFGFRG